MNITIYLSISALVYTVLIAVLFFTKKKIDTIENKVFKWMILVTLACLVSELSLVILDRIGNQSLFGITIKIFHICLYFSVAIFTIYAFVISFKEPNIKYREKYKVLCWFYLIFSLISIALLIILPLYSVVIDGRKYDVGPCIDFLHLVSLLHIVTMIFFLLKNIKHIKEKRFYPVIMYIVLMIAITILNNLFPGVLIANSAVSLLVAIMYHTIENPDLKMLHQVELARSAAEKANNAKSDFLSSISHEVRTPLNAIVGFSELTQNAQNIEEAKENSKDVIKASKVLLEIINGVLDISKIESGKIEITNETYKPYEMLNDVIKMLNYRFEEKKLVFNVNIAPDIPTTLYGDRSNIQKVITNLLTNAAKYTSCGHVDFTINCINKSNVCRLFISVEDTGRGIKPENIDKLFTKFNRLDEDKNTTNEGTGLGLAIIKHLVELMGGEITVQSKYGSGTKFTVTLNQSIQAPENEEVADATASTNCAADNNNQSSLTDKRVLLIDDNKLNIKIAAKYLSTYQCQIIEAISAQECLNMIDKGEKFDLLLADDMMPEMTGTEMMKKLKSSGYSTPIVVLTANVMDGQKEQYLKNGFDDYLGKPIDKKELNRVLKKYLTV